MTINHTIFNWFEWAFDVIAWYVPLTIGQKSAERHIKSEYTSGFV